MTKDELRAACPISAAWVDQMREVFGEVKVLHIKEGAVSITHRNYLPISREWDNVYEEKQMESIEPVEPVALVEAGELVKYDIFEEDSDVRAHVSSSDTTVYVFKTENGRRAVRDHNVKLTPARQKGVSGVAGMGWLIEIAWVDGIIAVPFNWWPHWSKFKGATTSEKGRLASQCVTDLMLEGLFPFWVVAVESEDRGVQIRGTDIVVIIQVRVQVKGDMDAGAKGRLFIQHSEANPLKRH